MERAVLPAIVVETPSATATSAIVILRRRRGVSHESLIRPSHARAPLAPAPAVIAPIMHCMHMRYAVSGSGTAS